MKTKKNVLLITALLFLTILSSCSSSDDNDLPQAICLKDDLTLTETKVNDLESVNSIHVDFDVKNNSSTNLDHGDNRTVIYITMNVKTTDGSVYETKKIFLLQLSAGSTTTTTASADYGSGKVFDSYTYKLTCEDL